MLVIVVECDGVAIAFLGSVSGEFTELFGDSPASRG